MLKTWGTALRGPLGIALLGAVPALPGAFVLAGILQGADAEGMMHDLVQPRYFTRPEPIVIHIASGILFCILAPLQFSTGLRMRYRKLHRIGGQVTMIAGLVFALTAIALMGPPPVAPQEWPHYTGLGVAGFGVCLSLCLSFWAIRRGDVIRHHQWMRRVIAFGLIGASRILFDVILSPIFGAETPLGEGISIWLAMALNLLIAERLSKTGR